MNRKYKICMGILLTVVLFLIYYINRQVLFVRDDIWYSTNLVTGEPLKSIADVIESQIWHYNNWGGRSVAHFFLQLILMGGEIFADILNVIATFALAYMICVMADAKSLWGVLVAIAMLIGLNGDFINTMFWQSGALNYLYLTIFILFYLWCYLREDLDKRLYGINIWILPLGLIVGWSNENMGPMAWILSLIVIICRIIKKEKIKIWMILGNISCLIGSVLVVAAPGNFIRSEEVAAVETKGNLWQIFLRCYSECSILFQVLFYAVVILVILGVIAKVFLQIDFGKRNWLLIFGAILSWGAMILSPHYPVRATFGTLVLLICVIISMLKKMLDKEKKSRYVIIALSSTIGLRAMFVIGQYLSEIWGWLK